MEQNLEEIVREIEEEQALNKISAVKVFRGMLNQPELVSISSANAVQNGSSYAYSSFVVNMPRPILEAETLQLLAANIPLCTQNFPDTACGFWYYRMDAYSGTTPNTENLFFVRLLPSYYKPEFIDTPANYGFNVTFNTYNDIATQLSKSCYTDLAFVNLTAKDLADPNTYQLQFIPSDIGIAYDPTQNKFDMTGQNISAPLFAYSSADTYNGATTYSAGQWVTYQKKVYRSLVSSTGKTPSLTSVYWAFVTDKLVSDYTVGTAYRTNQLVVYPTGSGNIRMAGSDIYAQTFGSENWISPPTEKNYRYLVTGYADPNVVINQGTGYRQWSTYAVYEAGEKVQYNGTTYEAAQQNQGWLPFLTAGATTYNTSKTDYKAGDVVSRTQSPPYVTYWKCIYSNPPANSITDNPFTCSTYWIPSYWKVRTDTNPPIIGLNAISSKFDMGDTWLAARQYPFPFGVPGQPFNPKPRRLLNSLLGFCWNGVFDASAVNKLFGAATEVVLSLSSDTTNLLNRIRPVPKYWTFYSSTNLGAGISINATTFTADGYANLVYSSVVSIYTTIVYGSTLDSQRNTNLLGLSSLNAGNLGVSFFDNKINGPLRVKGADIYSIGIELRDECDEPYPLFNTAITTFTLKLSYKENKAEV